MTADETPQQHARNALMILAAGAVHGSVMLTPDEYQAVRARLERAIEQLETR